MSHHKIDICIYCGEPATWRTYRFNGYECDECHNEFVAICSEIETLAARRIVINACLRIKYASLLEFRAWSEDELKSMGPSLRASLEQIHKEKYKLEQRLRYGMP